VEQAFKFFLVINLKSARTMETPDPSVAAPAGRPGHPVAADADTSEDEVTLFKSVGVAVEHRRQTWSTRRLLRVVGSDPLRLPKRL
jgi:hypothetical protein